VTARGWLLFAAMSIIWGVPYLLIKVAVVGMAPPFVVFARTAIGAVVLLPIAARRGQIGPALRRWRWLVPFAVIEMAGPWLLLSDAERRVTSGLAGLLIACAPLIVAVISWRLGDALDAMRIGGLLLGVVGVAVVIGANLGAAPVLRMVEVIAVAVGYALAPIIADRKLSDVPSLALTAVSLGFVAALYAPVGLWAAPRTVPSARALISVGLLGVICTAVALLLFVELVAAAGPARASMIAFLNPVVAVVAGAIFSGERFSLGTFTGAVLVLAGVFFAARRRAHPERGIRLARGGNTSMDVPATRSR
jgi:drug/metabolite transporter (DMT)-like permease